MLAAALVKDLGTLVEQEIPATIADLLAEVEFPLEVGAGTTTGEGAGASVDAGAAASAGARIGARMGGGAGASAGAGSQVGFSPGSPPSAVLLRTLAYISQVSPTFSLRGGTREILRGVIARGLALR